MYIRTILKHPPLACKMVDFKQLQCSGKVNLCGYDHVSMKGKPGLSIERAQWRARCVVTVHKSSKFGVKVTDKLHAAW